MQKSNGVKSNKNSKTKYKQKDKVHIKGKVQIKKYKTKTYQEGTGNRQKHEQTWTEAWGDADRNNEQTRSEGKTQTKYADTDEQTRNRWGEGREEARCGNEGEKHMSKHEGNRQKENIGET